MSTDYNPFQSPAAPVQPGVGAAWPIIPFQSGHQRAMAAIAFLAVTALICIAGTISAIVQYSSLEQLPDGSFAVTGAGATIEQASRLLSFAAICVWIGTVVTFSMWTHRAARNLPALGARGLKYTPGWAVGWFFIPLAHLVMPYFVAAEIWRESDPAQKHLDAQGGKTTSPLVASWWFTYVIQAVLPTLVGATVGGIFGYLGATHRHTDPQEIARQIYHYLPLLLLAGLSAQALGSLAAILAIFYVRGVDVNQQAKVELSPSEGFVA
jgi:hypothetical protein